MYRLCRLVLVTSLLSAVACAAQPELAPTPPLAATPTPSLVVPVRTATTAAVATLAETEPLVPTGTPRPANSPSVPATFTATPRGRLGPQALPPGINPLTGEAADDPALLAHRPLAVKIVNEPDCARPQYGLYQAAVVFEHYVEAWGTRFTAIFYGQAVDRIGAIRSARLIDLELPAIFDAGLVTTGSSGGVKLRLQASDFADRVIAYEWDPICPPFCSVPIGSVPCQDLEHTMFARLPDLWAQAGRLGFDRPPNLSGWSFSPQPLVPGEPAEAVRVGYLNSPVDWRYDEAVGEYLRWQDGNRHVAAETNRRLSASNVVVLFAHHLYTDIRESSNFYSLEIQLWGQGPALMFRDGQAFEAMWVRQQRAGLFELVDAGGAPLPLKPGPTWFELVALDSPVTAANAEWTVQAAVLPQQTPPRQ